MQALNKKRFQYDASILENIRYGRPDASDDEIHQAAQLAEVSEFVNGLPNGWGSRINYVLISHADMEHIGGLPYLFAKLGADVPVYATLPVHYMGQMMFYDLLLGNFHRIRETY